MVRGSSSMTRKLLPWGLLLLALLAGCTKAGERPQPTSTAGAAVNLRSALLTMTDLPGSGWSEQEPSTSDLTNECVVAINDVSRGDRNERASYTKGQNDDQVAFSVAQFADGGAAQGAMSKLREALHCPSWTENVDGSATTFHLSAADAPVLGDEAVAYRADLDVNVNSSGRVVHITSNVIAFRRGKIISNVNHFRVRASGQAPLNRALVDELAKRAEQKLVGAGL